MYNICMDIIEEIKKYIESGDKVVAAVSGGVDSMVMLHALEQAKETTNFDLSVITVEHGIRGQESKNDAAFVADYCFKHNINCKVENVDVPKMAKDDKQTIEEAARNLRYGVFDKYSKDNKIFIAHHASDQVETILMHIFRGSGINGATGIKSRDNIIRPFLNVTKADILEYTKKNKIKYVVDSTNDDISYTRNYLRKEIIAKIEKIYPNFETNIIKFATICKEYEDIISEMIKNEWFSAKNNQIFVSNDAFLQNNLVSNKVINIAYNKCGEYSDLEKKHVDLIIELFNYGKTGSSLNAPHGVVVEKRSDGLYFYKGGKPENNQQLFTIGKVNFGGIKIASKFCEKTDVVFGDGQYVDYEKIPANATWRYREPGDMFEKLGSYGRKKLNDYFTDKKFSKNERDNLPVLASGNNIFIVLGKDISNLVKIDSNTEKIEKIFIEK